MIIGNKLCMCACSYAIRIQYLICLECTKSKKLQISFTTWTLIINVVQKKKKKKNIDPINRAKYLKVAPYQNILPCPSSKDHINDLCLFLVPSQVYKTGFNLCIQVIFQHNHAHKSGRRLRKISYCTE